MSLTLHIWPLRYWLIWRVDNCVCDWTLRAGPLSVNIDK